MTGDERDNLQKEIKQLLIELKGLQTITNEKLEQIRINTIKQV